MSSKDLLNSSVHLVNSLLLSGLRIPPGSTPAKPANFAITLSNHVVTVLLDIANANKALAISMIIPTIGLRVQTTYKACIARDNIVTACATNEQIAPIRTTDQKNINTFATV